MRGKLAKPHRHAHGKGCCSPLHLFVLVSLTLSTTLWLQISLSNELAFDYTGHVERSLARSIRRFPRTIVAFDEFFKKPASHDVIQEFFLFDEPSETDIPTLNPLWTCEEKNRRGKLVYLHMYRSAGFTVRALLRGYARFCDAGIAFVSHCVDVSHASMEGNEFWMNEGLSSPRQGNECWLSLLENRTGEEYSVEETNSVTTNLLKDNQVDILGDHLPIGALQNWKDQDDDAVDVRYITWFRAPIQKFVSNHIFANRGLNSSSIKEIAHDVYVLAERKRKEGKYLDRTSNHFMTPDQKWWVDDERIEWTHERRANLTMKNLVDFGVMVGLVERFPESLELLQYLIDRNGTLTEMFEFFSSPEKVDKVNEGKISTSRQTTESVVSAIQSNVTQRAAIDEYLKYEQQIYNFAVKLHHVQWAKLPRKPSFATNS